MGLGNDLLIVILMNAGSSYLGFKASSFFQETSLQVACSLGVGYLGIRVAQRIYWWEERIFNRDSLPGWRSHL